MPKLSFDIDEILRNNPDAGIVDGDRIVRHLPPQAKGDAAQQLSAIIRERRSEATVAERNADNRAKGEALQQRLDAYHARLQADGVALVHRTDPPVRYKGDGNWVVVGKGPVDYIAFCAGFCVIFDAKVRSGTGYTVAKAERHQLQFLRDAAALGHVAGYLVEWCDHDTVRWHDVATGIGYRLRMADGEALNGVNWHSHALEKSAKF